VERTQRALREDNDQIVHEAKEMLITKAMSVKELLRQFRIPVSILLLKGSNAMVNVQVASNRRTQQTPIRRTASQVSVAMPNLNDLSGRDRVSKKIGKRMHKELICWYISVIDITNHSHVNNSKEGKTASKDQGQRRPGRESE
jgi:hypothetical protein